MKQLKRVSGKIMALIICAMLILSVIPVSVITAFAETNDEMGVLSGITAGGTLEGENGEAASITYSDASLVWSKADPSVGRMTDGWWIGVKMEAPANLTTKENFEGVTYQRLGNDGNYVTKNFWDVKDSKDGDTVHFLNMWVLVNEQHLNEALSLGTNVVYDYHFNWNPAKEGNEQSVKIIIKPDEIKLNKDNAQVYPTTDGNGKVEALTDGLTVKNANSNFVEVVYTSDVTMKWQAKDLTAGRGQDGWWAGMKITAPDTLQVESDFEGVTYQRKDGNTWTADKSFWNAKDSKPEDTTHFLTMWGLINEAILENAKAKGENGTANYTYRFDWNKDGVYEQTVVLKINPQYITLLDENDTQVYPKLATVEALTGGTVTGSATGIATVDVANTALNWSPKDESIGRNYDAWWAGAKITAPEDSTATTLANAEYRNRATSSSSATGWNEWTSPKKFLEYKDGDYFITVWTSADRQLVEKYIDKEMKIQSQYEFDWDGDGSYDQVITISIDPKTVTLNRVDRTDFVFADSAENKEIWVADGSTTNVAGSVKAPGTVTYEIDAAKTTVDGAQVDNTGKVTFKTIGEITVKATIAEDDIYNAKTISYSFNVVKKQPENLNFAIEKPSNIVYGQNENVFENAINVPEDCKVEYSIKSQKKLEDTDSDVEKNPVATIDKDSGDLTIKRSGEITVVATITADDPKYKDKSAEYTLTINKADQTGFAFTTNSPESFVYSKTAYDTVKVEGGQVDDAEIKYSITEGTDVAEIVDTNKIKTLKAGIITLSVTKDGNDCYKPVTITREIEVTHAGQTNFKFDDKTTEVTYNENGNKYTFTVSGGESTSTNITYEVLTDKEVADFANAENPELTIKKSGTVKVKATKAGDDCYLDCSVEYELEIKQADQTFSFGSGAAVEINYGVYNSTNKYINTIVPNLLPEKADGKGFGEGAYTYEISENGIGATIDAEGNVSFADSDKKVGSVTVTVTKAEDEKYNKFIASYELTVRYADTPANPYTIDKTKTNGWYKEDTTISVPEGYVVSYDNKLSTTDWANSVVYSVEGKTTPVIYLRSTADGSITDAVKIEGYQLDKKPATDLAVEYNDVTIWQTLLETVFGFKNENVTVTLTAKEDKDEDSTTEVSGLDYVEYILDGSNDWTKATKVENFTGSCTFDVKPEYRNQVKFRVTDKAGNTAEYAYVDEGGKPVVLVVDSVTPEVAFTYDYHGGYNNNVEGIIYSEKEVTFGINLTAANFDLRKSVEVKVNGETQDNLQWNTDGTANTTSIDFNDTGDYVVEFTYEDYLGRTATKTQEIRVDKEKPLIDVEFDPENADKNGKYFKQDRKAMITVTEHNFRTSEVVAIITAKNITGNNAADIDYIKENEEDIVKKYREDLANPENWYYLTAEGTLTKDVSLTENPDVHVAEIEFATDAQYTFKLDYSDLANNPAEQYKADDFVIDHNAPVNVDVDYNKPELNFVQKVIGAITFGFYNPKAVVTVKADDITSGVDYYTIKVEKNGSDNATTANMPKGEVTVKADGTVVIPESETADYAGFIKDISVKTNVENKKDFKISFKVPANFRGEFIATATDMAGNTAKDGVDNNVLNDNNIVIVDDVPPNVTVSYSSEATPHYLNEDMTDVDEKLSAEEKFKAADRVYYNGDVTATITINDANFFEGQTTDDGEVIHNIGILATAVDNDGNVTKTEYLPAGAESLFAKERVVDSSSKEIAWAPDANNADTFSANITLNENADYTIKFFYTDLSNNASEIEADDITAKEIGMYVSKQITVDKIAPVVSVDYSNDNIINTIAGRDYSTTNQTVTFTVDEHNFRAADFASKISATYSDGSNIGSLAADYEAYFANKDNWYYLDAEGNITQEAFEAENSDIHLITYTFDTEANYTFDYSFEDLAHNNAANYEEYKFTYDKTAPTNLKVDYSTNVFENILEHITFGYYNAQMTVTISADDDVAGVHHYVYSYIKNSGVSDVNAELINEAIAAAEITQSGKTFTTTFTIPKLALKGDNQFNGIVEFAAYDRSENLSETLTDKSNVIVVDNIKPTATVTFNDPVQKVNDVSYYAGDINATVVITEANFFAEDVNITVTKDGAAYPVSVKWTDNSVDVHTGTFTLTEDGDYVVSVDYKDRSQNEMTPFVSNQLTIDTVDPVITVSDVKHQSANNQETISLTVSVTDTNIALEGFKPVLKVVVKKDNGDGTYSYVTQNVDLGASRTTVNANGETVHSYTISNIATDGYYSLVCTAVDYANHSVSIIRSQNNVGGSAEVETVNFSVNRDGSVFWIETEHNDKYTGETFKDALDGAYANDNVTIKLHEVNVDKVDENADKKTVFTLNDGSESEDIVLNDSNYEKNTLIGAGGWYENIYTLNNDNFDHDGVYSFNIITYDAATNSNVNTKEEAGTISFTLDRTKPVITANVKTDQRINDTKFPVEFKITETNLNAETITVKLRDRNGKIVKTDVEDLGNNEYKFTVEDGLNYSFEVTATDLAGNESEILKVDRFTVSTNILVLWYANTPLFWGSIGGVVLVACAIVFFILYKKKKNQEN